MHVCVPSASPIILFKLQDQTFTMMQDPVDSVSNTERLCNLCYLRQTILTDHDNAQKTMCHLLIDNNLHTEQVSLCKIYKNLLYCYCRPIIMKFKLRSIIDGF